MKTAAIIPAAGSGLRMGYAIPKTYLKIDAKPILAHTLLIFQNSDLIDDVYVVVKKTDVNFAEQAVVRPFSLTKVKAVIPGGKLRQDSINNVLPYLCAEHELIVIHDGARPLLNKEILEKTIQVGRQAGAAVAGVPVKETVKSVDKRGIIKKTVDRKNLFLVQTPQVFNKETLIKAYEAAYQEQYYGTDDASLVERIGTPVKIVEGSYENIKITTPEDLIFAEIITRRRELVKG
ncbi:MAG: 2-C-methyl-D-erythritol 4-phosphate cytidylyltransferase [Deltaproteobacteria bacterium]|jgi:2-C-methyl-D-erythritol 4-phosphate cytidylyltransferase|nr:2-C-methyl-D-erythritol 4-phosphate cytidylyltransferase [Deltaproteobacteria bacterium]